MTENSSQKNAADVGKTENEEMSFADLFEMEENSSVSKVGDVIMGTIVGIVDDHVLVDIGDKAEAIYRFTNYTTKVRRLKSTFAMPLKSLLKNARKKADCCYHAKRPSA